jgi:hypothetical protein
MTITITLTGPLWTKGRPILERALQNIVQTLVEAGESHLDEVLRPRPAGVYLSVTPRGTPWGGPGTSRPGRGSVRYYRQNIHGVAQHLNGRIDDGGVVYGPWLEGTSTRNATTRFKGYASFRRTAQWLNDTRKATVIQREITQAIQEMNG